MLHWREERREKKEGREKGGEYGQSLGRGREGEKRRSGRTGGKERRGKRERKNKSGRLRRLWSAQSRLKWAKNQRPPPAPLPSRPQDGNYKAKSSGEVTRFYQPAAPNARGAGAAAVGLCDSCPLSKGGLGPSERHPNNCLLILARLYFGIYYSLSRQIPL